MKVVYPIEEKVQQSSVWTGVPESIAKKRGCKRTSLFLPLNCIITLWSNLSLFKYY